MNWLFHLNYRNFNLNFLGNRLLRGYLLVMVFFYEKLGVSKWREKRDNFMKTGKKIYLESLMSMFTGPLYIYKFTSL
jgi:hypothetical protein